MLIEILDPTMDGTLKIINPEGESCGVISFTMEVSHLGYDSLATITMNIEAYKNILGESIR